MSFVEKILTAYFYGYLHDCDNQNKEFIIAELELLGSLMHAKTIEAFISQKKIKNLNKMTKNKESVKDLKKA